MNKTRHTTLTSKYIINKQITLGSIQIEDKINLKIKQKIQMTLKKILNIYIIKLYNKQQFLTIIFHKIQSNNQAASQKLEN